VSVRIHLPKELERLIKTESGHRCAIPTCKQYPVEIAHIISYAQVKEHKFSNLIALCPTCHTRYDNHEIDLKAMFIYKSNLAIINSRFTELELTLLENLNKKSPLPISGAMMWLFQRLVFEDIIMIVSESGIEFSDDFGDIESHLWVELTAKGNNVVSRWLEGKPVDE